MTNAGETGAPSPGGRLQSTVSAAAEPGLVSVVIAAYNMAQYLPAAIRSVLAQTYGRVEVIVVDDGSTDSTADVLLPFHGDARVRVVVQSNRGQTRAKNRGVAEARGEYVAFCDADDLWTADKLERQMPLLSRSERVGVVYASAAHIDADGNPLPDVRLPHRRGRITEALFVENFIPFGTAVVRRALLARHGSFDERLRMGIDWELWLRLSVHCEFDFVDDNLYLYRVWPGQMSKNWSTRFETALRIMDEFSDRHPEAISAAVRRRAYAVTYANRARTRLRVDRDRPGALRDSLMAIRADALSFCSWRSLVYSAIAP